MKRNSSDDSDYEEVPIVPVQYQEKVGLLFHSRHNEQKGKIYASLDSILLNYNYQKI